MVTVVRYGDGNVGTNTTVRKYAPTGEVHKITEASEYENVGATFLGSTDGTVDGGGVFYNSGNGNITATGPLYMTDTYGMAFKNGNANYNSAFGASGVRVE